jgi:hypothetical protein
LPACAVLGICHQPGLRTCFDRQQALSQADRHQTGEAIPA